MEHAFVLATVGAAGSGLWLHGMRAAVIAFALGRRVERLKRREG